MLSKCWWRFFSLHSTIFWGEGGLYVGIVSFHSLCHVGVPLNTWLLCWEKNIYSALKENIDSFVRPHPTQSVIIDTDKSLEKKTPSRRHLQWISNDDVGTQLHIPFHTYIGGGCYTLFGLYNVIFFPHLLEITTRCLAPVIHVGNTHIYRFAQHRSLGLYGARGLYSRPHVLR